MSGFCRDEQGHALLAGTLLADLVRAAGTGTPVFAYDLGSIREEVRALRAALNGQEHLVAYAVKANSAGSVLKAVFGEGAGADVVSRGELELVLAAGVPASRVVMSGVAKRDDEIDAALQSGIFALQLESVEEVERVAARSTTVGKPARVSLRINPGVTFNTHAHIATGHDEAKFGIGGDALPRAFERADALGVHIAGLSAHIGSMLTEVRPYAETAQALCRIACERRDSGKPVEFVDFGGGFAVDYGGKPTARPDEFARAAVEEVKRARLNVVIVVEPGRSMVAAHGVLVARVIQTKVAGARRWCFIDAAMNDLIRPALYSAKHRVEPVDRFPAPPAWRVAGPVCESADAFGEFDLGPSVPEFVVIRDAGAYGFVMASQYNGRPLPAEIFAEAGRVVSVSASPGRDAWVSHRLKA